MNKKLETMENDKADLEMKILQLSEIKNIIIECGDG